MRNYVIRWTRTEHGHIQGQYATQGMGYGVRGNTPDIDGAYVFNTRMNRSSALHTADKTRLEGWGAEIVYVSLMEKPNV